MDGAYRPADRTIFASGVARDGLGLVFAATDGILWGYPPKGGGFNDGHQISASARPASARAATQGSPRCGDQGARLAVSAQGGASGGKWKQLRGRDRFPGPRQIWPRARWCAAVRATMAKWPHPSIASSGCPDKGFRFLFAPVIFFAVPRDGILVVAQGAGRSHSVAFHWIRRQPITSGPPMTRIRLRGCRRRAVVPGDVPARHGKPDRQPALGRIGHHLSACCGRPIVQPGEVGWRDQVSV